MRAWLPLLVIMSACGSDTLQSSDPVANATITLASTSFDVSDWRYRLHTEAGKAKVEMAASNGNTCVLMTNPNGPNVRVVHAGAFSITNTTTGATALPTGPGTFPVEENAALGNAGAVWFYATGASGQPLVIITQTINPTAPYADNGNVIMTAFNPDTTAVIDGSAKGSLQGTKFYYTFTAQACP